MFFDKFLLAVESRDLSQAYKSIKSVFFSKAVAVMGSSTFFEGGGRLPIN